MINQLSKDIHEINKKNGFYEDEKNIGEMLMLIVTEVAEACESDRVGNHCDLHEPYDQDGSTTYQDIQHEDDMTFEHLFKLDVKDTFEDELADIMIRVMDLSAFKGIDLESHIKAKMRFNSLREYKHGKKY